jgi:phospholipase C
MASPFRRVVVLMFENHSFDHLLGWVPGVGALTDKDYQWGTLPSQTKACRYHVSKVTSDPQAANTLNPGHTCANAIAQMYGTGGITKGVAPTMANFLQENITGSDVSPQEYMACYTPEQVPVMAALATSYVTCAQWFSSVPGPTGPNRLFTHCATSGGYCGNSFAYDPHSFVPPMPSIFCSLQAAQKTWSIYWDGMFSTAYALADIAPYRETNFFQLDQFFTDVPKLGSKNLPEYIFITPSLNSGGSTGQYTANSMHGGQDGAGGLGTVPDGETLLAQVYNALSADKEIWEETLLLVVFDEHGGWWDNAPPPPLPPGSALGTPPVWPKPGMPTDGIDFDFSVLGVRVPAIVISAWNTPYVDNATLFEHSSIPATLRGLFGLPTPLSPRDQYANTFHNSWPLSATPSAPIVLPQPWSP